MAQISEEQKATIHAFIHKVTEGSMDRNNAMAAIEEALTQLALEDQASAYRYMRKVVEATSGS